MGTRKCAPVEFKIFFEWIPKHYQAIRIDPGSVDSAEYIHTSVKSSCKQIRQMRNLEVCRKNNALGHACKNSRKCPFLAFCTELIASDLYSICVQTNQIICMATHSFMPHWPQLLRSSRAKGETDISNDLYSTCKL